MSTAISAAPPVPPGEHTLMTSGTARLLGVLHVAASVLALVVLMAAYGVAEQLVAEQEAGGGSKLATQTIAWWGPDFTVTLGMSILLVGAAAGVVGSVIHQSMVFAQRAGHETLQRGFVWWYILRPFWSGLLGAVAVVTFNAGLVSIGDQTTSAAGITVLVAVGCLAGLFTDQVLQRMRSMLGATPPDKRVVTAG